VDLAARTCLPGSANRRRAKTIFVSRINPIGASWPLRENIFLSFFRKLWLSAVIPLGRRGVARDRHDT